jgi:hypothetical protein
VNRLHAEEDMVDVLLGIMQQVQTRMAKQSVVLAS